MTPFEVDSLLERMTWREKVGQVFLLAFAAQGIEDARYLMTERGVGAAYLSNDNLPDPETAAQLTRTLQGYAQSTRLRVPLLLGVDQEGAWAVMTPKSAPGPGNMALGAARDPAITAAMYGVIARELRAVGLNTLFAPCADCNSNPLNSIIGMRSFGEDPALVSELVAAAVHATQTAGVVATAKHFPGHGDTTLDSHRGLPTVTRPRELLEQIDLAPFASAVRADVGLMMTAHIRFDALDAAEPATLSQPILQDLLRRHLGFRGVILSDSMNMNAMRKNYDPERAVVAALAAGVDLIMLAEEHYDHEPERYVARQVALLDAVERAISDGTLSEARLNDAVRRVLELKGRFASFEASEAAERAVSEVGSAPHREVELSSARAAVAVLRDEHGALPISAEKRVVLVNTTQRASYALLEGARGIGPNQKTPAFDSFAAEVRRQRPEVRMVDADTVLAGGASAHFLAGEVVVAVTENYPLPGMDFDRTSQPKVIAELRAALPAENLIVVGLCDPYELANLGEIPAYLCAFSFRECAAVAAAEALLGRIPIRGASPVSYAPSAAT